MNERRRPILLGTPEVISLVPETVRKMLDQPGIYIGSNPGLSDFGEAPLASVDGKIYSMKLDNVLSTGGFLPGTVIDGPFRAGCGAPIAQAVAILKRLVEWDRRYPKSTIHPMAGERELDDIIQDARTLLTGGVDVAGKVVPP